MKKLLILLISLLVLSGCDKKEHYDLRPMVLVNDTLYLDEGKEINYKNKKIDGTITSSVKSYKEPKKNNQSNFGSGHNYVIYPDKYHLIININDKCCLFEAQELND